MDSSEQHPTKKVSDPPGRATLTFECRGAGAPLVNRVKILMKIAGRSLGMTCLECRLDDTGRPK